MRGNLQDQIRCPSVRKKGDLLFFERWLGLRGVQYVAGVDEVGRGCLAGPVFAAAVILPPNLKIPGVTDSKQLTPKKRESLFEDICEAALAWGLGTVEQGEIDKINIHRASLKAMQEAVSKLKLIPEFILVDGRFPLSSKIPQKPIVKGDQQSQSVAAASILAKVSRDRFMMEIAQKYPQFSFQEHKGYGTPEHFREIKQFGLTPLHRRTFCVT